MDRRSRRGALALCAAFALCVTGATLQPRLGQTAGPAPVEATRAREAAGPVVVPDRYLIETDGFRGAAQAELLSAITATGAAVNLVYEDTWDGVSVTATEAQLGRILAIRGVHEVFPVYALQLDEPPTEPLGGSEDEPEPSDEPDPGDPGPTDIDPPDGAVPPVAGDDSFTVDYRTPAELDLLANDGDDPAPDPATIVFTDPGATAGGKELTIDGRGRFTVADGVVSFLSALGFTGELEPVTYQVEYADGAKASAEIRVTVTTPPEPAANDDTATATSPDPASRSVLANDDHGGQAVFQPDTLCLVVGEECVGAAEVDGSGVWSVADGIITFTPAPGFAGRIETGYRVTDELDRTASATLAVTVHSPPTASGHSVETPYLTPITESLLDDQGEHGAPLDPASLVLLDGDRRVTTLSIDGEGSYAVNADGSVTFTPEGEFVGASEVDYEVSSTAGATVSGKLLVTVIAPGAPTAGDDEARGLRGKTTTVNVLANDAADGLATLQPDSVCLVAGESCPTTVAAEHGTWSVDLEDGSVRFAASPDFIGEEVIDYRVSDELGQTATATIRMVVATEPIANDDTAHTAYRTPVTVAVLANDTPGEGDSGPGTWDSVRFSDGGSELTNDAGNYVIDDQGRITFTPAAGHEGPAEPVGYTATDSHGHSDDATLTVNVGAAPKADDDEATTKQNVAVTGIDVLANDTPGDDGDGAPVELLPDSVVFVATGEESYEAAGQGTWSVDAAGTVGFDPLPAFRGDATADYRVRDANGNTATATITVAVTPITPTAADDSGHAPARHSVEDIPVLANDEAGDESAPLLPETLVLVGAGTAEDGQTRSTADGTWTVNADDTVTFTPDGDFHGRETSTEYQVADANGTVAEATITVRIGALTTATDYSRSTPQNVTVILDPLDLVEIGDTGELDDRGQPVSGTLDLASMRFSAADPAEPIVLVSQGMGRWEMDPATGRVEFDPESAFVGNATAEYQVTDSFGHTVAATITVEVSEIVPVLADDTAHTPANHAVTIPVLDNDVPGHASAQLNGASVGLWQGTPSKPWTREPLSTEKGTWSVVDATIRFTPAVGATGASTLQYRVLDANGTSGIATVQVNVGALPKANDDATTVSQDGSKVTLKPLHNDTPGDDGAGATAGFAPLSVVLTDPKATGSGKTLTGSGYTLSVDSIGQVSFVPDWRFTGTVTSGYRVTDGYGNSTTAKITVTVKPTAPTATEQRLTAIGALQSNADGAGIKVGIIDSGIDYTHPDLGGTGASTFPTGRVTKGKDYIANGAPMDCFGHGTHVAGIVGADGNPKKDGAYGVAPKVTFGAYRVFNCSGAGTTDTVVKAMEQAAKDGMNVVNLSLGASSVSWPNETAYPLTKAAANLVKKGIVVVAATGNTTKGLFTAGSPGVAPGVISVAAVNSTNSKVESYSAMGLAADLSLNPTITAPGAAVYSTVPGSHTNKSGTSMAAPHVAGAVAEILRAKGWKVTAGTPAKVAALLYATATPVKSANSKLSSYSEAVFRQGAGLLRLDAALKAPVTASPSSLKLGEGTSETQTITLTNTGSKAVTYKVSALSGTSAAASTGSKTDVGNQTPDWAYAAVGFKASPSSITVPAKKTAKVKVTITAPSKILAKKQGMLYGGWVRFTASGQQTVSVPFAGLRGDYQKVKLLPSANRSFADANSGLGYSVKLPALAYSSGGALKPTTSGTRTFRPAKGDYPSVMFHLDYPASAIRLKATNTKTKKSYYAVLDSSNTTQWSRRGRDESYTAIAFYGVYKNSKGKRVAVPNGTYKLQLRVLKPLGSSSKSSHWETYTTRAFKFTWK